MEAQRGPRESRVNSEKMERKGKWLPVIQQPKGTMSW